MRIFFFLILICSISTTTISKNSDLKIKLNSLKKQTVNIHNEIVKNNKELRKIKVDIDRNTQKKNYF